MSNMLVKLLFATLAVWQTSESAPCDIERIQPVNLNLACFRYDKTRGDLSPILLIHGLTGSMGNWYSMYELLAYATQRKVCAIDLRNHGESGKSNETDVAALTADVHYLLKSHNVQKVNLIGHSLGGKVSVHYALNYPEKVDRLVVEDMRPNGITQEAKSGVQFYVKLLMDAIDTVPKGSTVEEAQNIAADYINKKFEELNIKRVDPRTLPIRCSSEVCEWSTYRAMLDLAFKDLDGALTQSNGIFNGPALFIYGTNSPFKVGEDKSQILQHFPNAELYGIQGADHSLHGIYREFDLQVIKFFNK